MASLTELISPKVSEALSLVVNLFPDIVPIAISQGMLKSFIVGGD